MSEKDIIGMIQNLSARIEAVERDLSLLKHGLGIKELE